MSTDKAYGRNQEPSYYPPAEPPDTYVGDLLLEAAMYLRDQRISTESKVDHKMLADIAAQLGHALNNIAREKVHKAAQERLLGPDYGQLRPEPEC